MSEPIFSVLDGGKNPCPNDCGADAYYYESVPGGYQACLELCESEWLNPGNPNLNSPSQCPGACCGCDV